MNHLKNNKFLIIIILGMILFSGFMKTEINKKEERIETLESKIEEKEKQVNKLSKKIKKYQESKDVHIVEIENADGSKRKEKRIISKKQKDIKEFEQIKKKESIKTVHNKDDKKYTKEQTIINPKKLSIGVGLNNEIEPYGIINYQFKGPFGVGGQLNQKGEFGVHFIFSF